MTDLLRILNFIVWSKIQEKLPLEARSKMPSPSTPELYLEYYKTFLKENKHLLAHSDFCNDCVSDHSSTSCKPQCGRSYRTSSSSPPIIRTSHPNAPAPFMIIPPLVLKHPGPLSPLFISVPPCPPDNSNLLMKMIASSSSSSDEPESKVKISTTDVKKDTNKKTQPTLKDSPHCNKVQKLTSSSRSTTTASSNSAPLPTSSPTNNSSNVVARRRHKTSRSSSRSQYARPSTKPSARYTVPLLRPSSTDYDVASTYNPRTSEYYSYPAYSTARPIIPALSAIFPNSLSTNYTYNATDSAYCCGVSECSCPPYTTVMNMAPAYYGAPNPTAPLMYYRPDVMAAAVRYLGPLMHSYPG